MGCKVKYLRDEVLGDAIEIEIENLRTSWSESNHECDNFGHGLKAVVKPYLPQRFGRFVAESRNDGFHGQFFCHRNALNP